MLWWTNPRCQVSSLTKFYGGARQLYVLSMEPTSRQPSGASNFRGLLDFWKSLLIPVLMFYCQCLLALCLCTVFPKVLTDESRGSPV